MNLCMRSKEKLGFARKNFVSSVSRIQFYSLRKRKSGKIQWNHPSAAILISQTQFRAKNCAVVESGLFRVANLMNRTISSLETPSTLLLLKILIHGRNGKNNFQLLEKKYILDFSIMSNTSSPSFIMASSDIVHVSLSSFLFYTLLDNLSTTTPKLTSFI